MNAGLRGDEADESSLKHDGSVDDAHERREPHPKQLPVIDGFSYLDGRKEQPSKAEHQIS